MCHLILLMPLITLPIFWLVPLPIALATYLPLLLVFIWIYARIVTTMHTPIRVGLETMLGQRGEVLMQDDRSARVRVMGEIWRAKCDVRLHPGDDIKVIGVKGLELSVSPCSPVAWDTNEPAQTRT